MKGKGILLTLAWFNVTAKDFTTPVEISVGVDYLSTEASVACCIAGLSSAQNVSLERKREGAVITIIVCMSHIAAAAPRRIIPNACWRTVRPFSKYSTVRSGTLRHGAI